MFNDEVNRLGFNDGVEAAAALVEGWAKDYDSMAAQAKKDAGEKYSLHRTADLARADGLSRKAGLLWGQVRMIRELKK